MPDLTFPVPGSPSPVPRFCSAERAYGLSSHFSTSFVGSPFAAS